MPSSRSHVTPEVIAPPAPTRGRDFAVGIILSGFALGLILAFTDLKTEDTALYRDPGWDRHLYRLMAELGIFEFRLAPYCWRVFVPAIAGWSPFSLQASFFTITLAALWATGVSLFLLARRTGHSLSLAAAGVLLSKDPGKLIREAVIGMLPKTKLGRTMRKKLKVYSGPQHPHEAQQPEALDVGAMNSKNKRA